jgi:hypothetical protein
MKKSQARYRYIEYANTQYKILINYPEPHGTIWMNFTTSDDSLSFIGQKEVLYCLKKEDDFEDFKEIIECYIKQATSTIESSNNTLTFSISNEFFKLPFSIDLHLAQKEDCNLLNDNESIVIDSAEKAISLFEKVCDRVSMNKHTQLDLLSALYCDKSDQFEKVNSIIKQNLAHLSSISASAGYFLN